MLERGLLLVKKKEITFADGKVLIKKSYHAGDSCPSLPPTPSPKAGIGWVPGGFEDVTLETSRGIHWSGNPLVEIDAGCGSSNTVSREGCGQWGPCGTAGSRAVLLPPLPSVSAHPVPAPLTAPPLSPQRDHWTSPLTWTSRASCVSSPAPLTTGCAEAAPGYSHPSQAGPARASGAAAFLGGFGAPPSSPSLPQKGF